MLAERKGHNAELPYWLTATTTKSGVEIVAPNCLYCHATPWQGKVFIGLPNATRDFSAGAPSYASALKTFAPIAGATLSPAERAELDKFMQREDAVAPHLKTRVRGPTSADNLAAVLAAHRDPKTLAWLEKPAAPLPAVDAMGGAVPVDVPPLWRVRKKNALYYNGFGRGDHARMMMSAALLCTDSVVEAQAIDAQFADVRAYLATLRPPQYPGSIDGALAARGKLVFERSCAGCHGTYGEGASYPNLLVDLDAIGTDGAIVRLVESDQGKWFVDWFNRSWYGSSARLEPAHGYMPPPLDGVWATAPYLHNGSVPTLDALLDSELRPRYWARDFKEDELDLDRVGVRHRVEAAPRPGVYDTTLEGYRATGHTFGDALTEDQRRSVIEYLKTL